jgi:hypothetical protein
VLIYESLRVGFKLKCMWHSHEAALFECKTKKTLEQERAVQEAHTTAHTWELVRDSAKL